MASKIDWKSQIGRQPKLRDLFVFSTVVDCGSMGKAARQLRVAQPTVSEAVANLEYMFGVRLLDRSSRGVEPTTYGAALLKRSIAVFDELKQTSRDIDFLTDATTGELKIVCPESIAATFLPQVIQRFYERYPQVILQVDEMPSTETALPILQDRKCDLILARTVRGQKLSPSDDLNIETLFDDRLVLAAGSHSRWARRRKIELAELIEEPWILMASNTWNYQRVAEAFEAQGLVVPKIRLLTFSLHLRTHLLAEGPFITALPGSALRSTAEHFLLKLLPVDLPIRPWPVSVVTLKNRTLSPVVERFIECTRQVTKAFSR